MRRKIILWFFITSGSLIQVFGNLPEKDSNASSDLYVRKKRVIDETHNRDERVLRQKVRYVVALLNHNHEIQCTGIILSPRVILTAAHCIYHINGVIVMSGEPRTPTQRIHTTAYTIIHENYDPKGVINNDLGMIIIRDPIDIYHSYNRAISIYNGTLPANSMGLFSGWGDVSRFHHRSASVRSTLLPILSQQWCHHLMHEYSPVTAKHICTHYNNREKCCWHGDSGGPLVYGGYLIGVFSTFDESSNPLLADIFMNLMDPQYKLWVEGTVLFINNTH